MYAQRGSESERTWNRWLVRTLLCLGLVALAVALVASGSTASVASQNATEIDHCTEITESGEYVLTEDIQPSAPENLSLDTATYPNSACIAVNATAVEIDGNGYEINGSAAHANGSGQYYGIRVQNLSDTAGADEASALSASISNVTLTEWSRGVYSYNSHALLVNETRITSDLPGQTSGLYLWYSDNATIRQNVVDGFSKGVVLLEGSHDANVTDNEVRNTNIAAIEAHGDRVRATANHIEDYGGSLDARGIYLDESADAWVADNVVLDGYEGIAAFGGPDANVTILNNTLRGDHAAIAVDDLDGTLPGSATVAVRNNTIDDFDRGIELQHRTAAPTVVDNDVTNAAVVGIALFGGSDHGLVESNVVTASDAGIWVHSNDTTVQDNDFSGNDRALDLRRSTDSTIRRNDLSGSHTVGAYLLGSNSGSVLTNNTITDSNGTGVEITVLNHDTSGVVLERNEITRNQAEGVLVDNENAPSEPGPRNPVVRGNNISANGAEGIFDGDGINATYVDNRVANNAERGIYVRGFARNATVRNNTVLDNGGVGIQLGREPNAETANATVEENYLSNNTDYAIRVDESPGVVVANNSMHDHETDLRLHYVSGVEVHDNNFETGIAFGIEDDEDYVHDVSGNEFHDGSPLYYAAGDTAPSVPQDAMQVIVVDADGLALSDLDVSTGSVPTGLLVATSNGSTVENVSVTGPARDGVRIVSLANATVDGATVDGARDGIEVEASPGIELTNATVTNVGGSPYNVDRGIRIFDSAGASVREGYVHNSSNIGIVITDSDGALVESTAVDETGSQSVSVIGSSGATLRDNAITDPTNTGITVSGSTNSTVEGTLVMGNANTNFGIRGIDSDAIELLDNHVEDVSGEGIATASSNNVTIHGTYAIGNDVGIAIGSGDYDGEANAVLQQNELIQNDLGLDGVEIVELVNNTIRDSTNDGASVTGSQGVTVSENVFRSNGGDGLYLDGASDATLLDNRYRDNGEMGLYIDVIYNATVANSAFRGNDVGLYDAGSTSLLIDSNTLRYHTTQAVELHGTDEFTVRNNTIESTVDIGYSAGVRTELASGDTGTIADNTFDSNDYGVQVAPENTDLLGANLTIRDNDFVANPEGVRVYAEADEVLIANNAFNGTTGEAVSYGASSPSHYLDARQNYWGAADGPSGSVSDPVTGTVADGSGDAVGSNVRFEPWLGDDSSVGSNLTADVSVVSASLNATAVDTGGAVTVTADVQNVGNASGSYSAELEIAGTVEDTTSVTVAPSVTETVEFTYTFATDGDYDVSVDGVSAGTVTVAAGGSGGDGDNGGDDGGSGGDGGGSGGGYVPGPAPAPEPAVTVEDTEAGADLLVTNVQASDVVTVPLEGTIQSGGVDLTALTITLSEAVDFEATIEAHEQAPADAGELPNDAAAIAYLDVSHGLDDGQIEGATVEFSVSTETLEARNLDPGEVALYHSVDGEWVERETTVVEERADAVDFRADVPHFSWFAIAGLQSPGSGSDDGGSDGTDGTGEDDGTDSEGTATGTTDDDADQSTGTDEETGDGSPGFGLAAAVLALVGAARLLRRESA